DKEAYYVFLVQKSENGRAGYMPYKQQVGFIFTESISSAENLAVIIAHELGHGAFHLKHIFEEYALGQSTTDNLMDYRRGARLHKYQWDEVHDPQARMNWFKGDEEMAYDDESNEWLTEIAYLLQNSGVTEFIYQYKCDDNRRKSFYGNFNENGSKISLEIRDEIPEDTKENLQTYLDNSILSACSQSNRCLLVNQNGTWKQDENNDDLVQEFCNKSGVENITGVINVELSATHQPNIDAHDNSPEFQLIYNE